MATNNNQNPDSSGLNKNTTQNINNLALQMATLTHHIVGLEEINEENEILVNKSKLLVLDARPSITHRNTALSQEYLTDLAVRVEKMCQLIFHLNGNKGQLRNLN